ncbi:MAG: SIMPL domain-containing protein [Clostridiales bacterium]|nr:SIMPL domain-containing protein [Clostridiales bacterium]
MRTIKVTQSASEKFPADCAVMTLRLSCEHKKYAEAVKDLSEKSSQVLVLLAGALLESNEIVTGGSAVDTVTREGKKLFRAHTEIKAELSVTDPRLFAAFDALEASGVAWTQSYTLKDDTCRTKLLGKAVDMARNAAETLAKASGVKVGKLQNIDYTSYGERPRVMRAMAMDAAVGAAAEPEGIELSETVTCEWEVE